MHPSIRWFLPAAVWLTGMASSANAQEDHPAAGYWDCYTDFNEPTVYTTPVWEMTAYMDQVTNGFGEFLFSKYGFKGRVFCGRANLAPAILPTLKTGDQRRNAQWKAQGKPVVETTYTFDPARDSLPYACYGMSRHQGSSGPVDSVFLSSVIRIRGVMRDSLAVAWNDFIIKVHSGLAYVPAGCILLSPNPEMRKTQLENRPTAYNVRSPAIVTLDWTYPPRP
jgi:hypothetical protein